MEILQNPIYLAVLVWHDSGVRILQVIYFIYPEHSFRHWVVGSHSQVKHKLHKKPTIIIRTKALWNSWVMYLIYRATLVSFSISIFCVLLFRCSVHVFSAGCLVFISRAYSKLLTQLHHHHHHHHWSQVTVSHHNLVRFAMLIFYILQETKMAIIKSNNDFRKPVSSVCLTAFHPVSQRTSA